MSEGPAPEPGQSTAQLVDVVTRLSQLQMGVVERVAELRRLRRYERRLVRSFGASSDFELGRRLEYLKSAIPLRRRDFVDANRNAAPDERDLVAGHQLQDDSPDWAVKYAAFNAAYAFAVEKFEAGGRGIWSDGRRLDEIDAAMPAMHLGNAIVGSAVHAFPLAGGVYKEIKDNVEGLVDLAKRLPGAAAGVVRVATGGIKRAGRRVKKAVRPKRRTPVPAGSDEA